MIVGWRQQVLAAAPTKSARHPLAAPRVATSTRLVRPFPASGKASYVLNGCAAPTRIRARRCLRCVISGFSAHADYNEILAWLMGFNRPPMKTFMVHGEPDASAALAGKIQQRLGWEVEVPKFEESVTLD